MFFRLLSVMPAAFYAASKEVASALEITDKYTDQAILDIRQSDSVSQMPSFMCRWEVDSQIGHGSFGSVYKITKISSNAGKPSALKVISVNSDDNVDFAHEVKILQSLDSTHLTHIEDFDEVSSLDGKRHYLLIRMELLKKLDRQNMSVDEIVNMGKQICSVLSVCHNSKPAIIHRDIKPDNIMVNDSGIYKLGDFGSSRIMGKKQTMTSIGTPYYMPPEIASFKDYDHRADIYSLAITMYILLNKGKHPFTDTDDKEQAIRRRMAGERLPDIPDAPPMLVETLRRATNPEPAYRYNTVEEFSMAIDAAMRQPTQTAMLQPASQPMPPRPVPQSAPSSWPVRKPVQPMPQQPMYRPQPAPPQMIQQVPAQPITTVIQQRTVVSADGTQTVFTSTTNGVPITISSPNSTGVNQFGSTGAPVRSPAPAFAIALTSIILGAFGLFLLLIALSITDLTVSFIGLIFGALGLICAVLARSQGNRSGMVTTGTIMAIAASVLFLLSLMISSC